MIVKTDAIATNKHIILLVFELIFSFLLFMVHKDSIVTIPPISQHNIDTLFVDIYMLHMLSLCYHNYTILILYEQEKVIIKLSSKNRYKLLFVTKKMTEFYFNHFFYYSLSKFDPLDSPLVELISQKYIFSTSSIEYLYL